MASAGYSGAITLRALLFGLLPALVVSAVVTAAVTRMSTVRAAALAGLVTALAAAEVVNVVAGQTNGPAARSTLLAAGLTALAVVAAASPFTTLFLVPLCGTLVGALALGAGGEVQAVAVATAVTGLVALGVVEGHRRRWSGRPTGRVAVVVLALFVGAAAMGAWLALEHLPDRAPAVLSSVSVDDTIRPPVIGAGALPITPPRNDSAPPTPSTSPAAESGPSVLEREARAALLLFAAGLLLLALRRVWVLLAWRRVRRRLRRGEPAAAVAGAWIWARRRLRLFGVTFPSALSPDQVAAGGAVDEVSHRVSRPLEDLAGRVTLATFAGGAAPARSQVLEAWQLADLAATGARRAQSPLRRVRVWFRGPSGRGAR